MHFRQCSSCGQGDALAAKACCTCKAPHRPSDHVRGLCMPGGARAASAPNVWKRDLLLLCAGHAQSMRMLSIFSVGTNIGWHGQGPTSADSITSSTAMMEGSLHQSYRMLAVDSLNRHAQMECCFSRSRTERSIPWDTSWYRKQGTSCPMRWAEIHPGSCFLRKKLGCHQEILTLPAPIHTHFCFAKQDTFAQNKSVQHWKLCQRR